MKLNEKKKSFPDFHGPLLLVPRREQDQERTLGTRQRTDPGSQIGFGHATGVRKCIKRANTFPSTSFHSLRKPQILHYSVEGICILVKIKCNQCKLSGLHHLLNFCIFISFHFIIFHLKQRSSKYPDQKRFTILS